MRGSRPLRRWRPAAGEAHQVLLLGLAVGLEEVGVVAVLRAPGLVAPEGLKLGVGGDVDVGVAGRNRELGDALELGRVGQLVAVGEGVAEAPGRVALAPVVVLLQAIGAAEHENMLSVRAYASLKGR